MNPFRCPAGRAEILDEDGDGLTEAVDCDDDDPEIGNGEIEICDG